MSKTNRSFKIATDGAIPLEHLRVVTQNDSRFSKIFYQITNHEQIFHLGSSFLKDFEQGEKVFALSSVIDHKSQRRTILGLSCYFDHVKDLKIAIISDNLDLDIFRDALRECKLENMTEEKGNGDDIKVYRFLSHFDFIPMEGLINTNNEGSAAYFYEKMVENVIGHYDLVFWDIPNLKHLKKDIKNYFPLITSTNSLSLILPKEELGASEVTEVKDYFENYGVKIKGFIWDEGKKKDHSILKSLMFWRSK